MAEIFEIDDIPSAASSNASGGDSAKEKVQIFDKHLPSFDFDSYPDVEDDDAHSPRIVDDVWKKYE
jgi:hypothetical protein